MDRKTTRSNRRTSGNTNDPDFDRGRFNRPSGALFNPKQLDRSDGGGTSGNHDKRKRSHSQNMNSNQNANRNQNSNFNHGQDQFAKQNRNQNMEHNHKKNQNQAQKVNQSHSFTQNQNSDPDRSQSTDQSQRQIELEQNQQLKNKLIEEDKSKLYVPNYESLVREVQAVYTDITKLEEACIKTYSQVGSKSFVEEEWVDVYSSYERLIVRYYDFVFLAYHPSGNATVRGLVKKYNIPLRMWNKGLFKFLDILRPHLPDSQDMMTKFTYKCFVMLSMLTEPPFESRNMWMEALAELARIQMQLPNRSEFWNWRSTAQFWYSKAMARSPGLGRIYHHCAAVSLFHLDSLFYFCKSMDSTAPFEPARDTVRTLFRAVNSHLNQPNAAYVKLHECIYTDHENVDGVDSGISGLMALVKTGIYSVFEMKHRSGILAICNIEGLLGYGASDNKLSRMLKDYRDSLQKESDESTNDNTQQLSQEELQKRKDPQQEDLDDQESQQSYSQEKHQKHHIRNQSNYSSAEGLEPGELSKSLSFQTLEWFLSSTQEYSLPHLVVWLHFILALSRAGCDAFQLWSQFPTDLVVILLNHCLESTYKLLDEELDESYEYKDTDDLESLIATWRKVLDPELDMLALICQKGDAHFRLPSYKQMALPEEVALLGFSWPENVVADKRQLSDLELGVNDDLFPGCNPEPRFFKSRPVRVVELALALISGNNTSLHFGETGFYVGEIFEDDVELDSLYDLNRGSMDYDDMSVSSEPPGDPHQDFLSSPMPGPRYAIFETNQWLDIPTLETLHQGCDFIAVSQPQLIELYAMAQDDPNAQRAIRWILQGLGKGTVRFFTQQGIQMSRIDPESITDKEPSGESIYEFARNLKDYGTVELY